MQEAALSPGDSVVGLHHVKQPAEDVGPLRLLHDHEHGQTRIFHVVDLVAITTAAGSLSAIDAGCALFETDKPTSNQREKARRRLDQLVRRGELVVSRMRTLNTERRVVAVAGVELRLVRHSTVGPASSARLAGPLKNVERLAGAWLAGKVQDGGGQEG